MEENIEVLKVNQEVGELTLGHDGLIEDLDTLRERNRLLPKRGKDLQEEKVAVKVELAGTKEVLSQVEPKYRSLRRERRDVHK